MTLSEELERRGLSAVTYSGLVADFDGPQEVLDGIKSLEAENERLRATLDQVGRALETVMLAWDGTIADPKLMDAYQGLKAYRAAHSGAMSE